MPRDAPQITGNSAGAEEDSFQLFEQDMRTFLTSMGCTAVKGGINFHIAPPQQSNQIDACGRYGNILFIVECTAANRRSSRPTDLRTKIMGLHTKIQLARQAYRNIPEYADCDTIVPIFATKKYALTEANERLLKDGIRGQRIYHIEETFLEYYGDLIDMVGHYAIFNILYEFGINPPREEKLITDAIKTKIKGYDCYLFYAQPKDLLKFTYVARRNSQKENFYQRALTKSRLSAIRKFVENSGKFFPTNLVISLKGHGKYYFAANQRASPISSDFEIGKLELRNSYAVCWIIDGQHRLYSFAKSSIQFPVPCIAIEDPHFEKERDFFVDINKEQKTVPSDLIWDLEGDKDPGCKTEEGLISNVVKTLDNGGDRLWDQEKSPFIGKVDMPSSEKTSPIIKLAAFCNGILNAGITSPNLADAIGGGNPMLVVDNGITSKNRLAKTIAKYFTMIDEKTSDGTPFNIELNSFLLGNTGVPILLYVLEPVLSKIGASVPNREQLRQYIDLIISYFGVTYQNKPAEIKKLKQVLTGEGARRNISREIGRHMKAQLRDEQFWTKLGNPELYETIVKIERALGNMLADKLYSMDSEWQRRRLPQGMFDLISRRMRAGGNFQDYLNIGDEKSIIIKADNWDSIFNTIFTGEKVFQDKNEFSDACDNLGRNRAPWAHGRAIENVSADLQLCKGFIGKFRIVLKSYLQEDESG